MPSMTRLAEKEEQTPPVPCPWFRWGWERDQPVDSTGDPLEGDNLVELLLADVSRVSVARSIENIELRVNALRIISESFIGILGRVIESTETNPQPSPWLQESQDRFGPRTVGIAVDRVVNSLLVDVAVVAAALTLPSDQRSSSVTSLGQRISARILEAVDQAPSDTRARGEIPPQPSPWFRWAWRSGEGPVDFIESLLQEISRIAVGNTSEDAPTRVALIDSSKRAIVGAIEAAGHSEPMAITPEPSPWLAWAWSESGYRASGLARDPMVAALLVQVPRAALAATFAGKTRTAAFASVSQGVQIVFDSTLKTG
jgi:hypothetical protein